MTEAISEKVRSHSAAAGELLLHRWRGELRQLTGYAGVRWAFLVTRLETSPERAHALLLECAPEIPPEARPLYDGAARLLLAVVARDRV